MLSCSARVMCALRKEMFEKMQSLPISFFDGRTHGELMSYYTNDTEAVNELLHHSITQMLISISSLVFVFGMMASLSIPVVFIMICMGVTVFYVGKTTSHSTDKRPAANRCQTAATRRTQDTGIPIIAAPSYPLL